MQSADEPQLSPIQERQFDRERKKRSEHITAKEKRDLSYEQSGSGSQARASKGLMQVLVPAVAWWLDNHYEAGLKRARTANVGAAQFSRMRGYVTTSMMAHIAVTVVLDKLGRGSTFRTPINTVRMWIGKHIEDQAMLEYMNLLDPYAFKKLQKKFLHDPVRRYDKKIYAMEYVFNDGDLPPFKRMTERELGCLGALMLRAVMSIPACKKTKEGFFEAKRLNVGRRKSVNYLALSQTGIKYRDRLLAAANKLEYKPLPMVCEPNDWSLTDRGGYFIPPPREYAQLISNHNPTVPSQAALDALNKLQKVPYRINTYILDLQQTLLKRTNEIGCFRSYEADSWKEEHFPVVDSAWLDTLAKDSSEYRSTMRKLKQAYHQQKLDEKEGVNPQRIASQAEELRNEVFYTPWFFDSRLRLYPITELGVTRGDFVKALMVNAYPLPVTDTTERDLLIGIATSGDFGKVSKKSYEDRIAWAQTWVNSDEFEENVLYPEDAKYWREADEPFQFLAYCEEYYAIYKAKTRNTTRVFIGRDMSCSGIQFLSSLIGDEKAMSFTNVIPGEAPRDAYAEVARLAREYLSDPKWYKPLIDKREEKRLKWNEQHKEKDHRQKRMHIDVNLPLIDRGVVKTQVMVTGYGGTYLSKRQYIIEKLKELTNEKEANFHPADYSIIVQACIEGMSTAFPQYTELNNWFKQVASAAIKSDVKILTWKTPNGSLIAQDYREPDFITCDTYAANGGHYSRLVSDDRGVLYVQTGWKDEVKGTKHASAIAANFTHSLDSCMIQEGVNAVDDNIPVFTVHDCVYSQPGYTDQVVPHFREAFLKVVSAPVLESLLEENGLTDTVQLLDTDDTDPSVCVNSEYMFS